MSNRYWVIGGEFNTAFERLMDGTQRVLGPYADRDTAKQAWGSWRSKPAASATPASPSSRRARPPDATTPE